MVVQSSAGNGEFAAGFGPSKGVEVLGYGRNSVWVTHSENEVGDIGSDKAKVVDAPILIEDEFRR